MYSCLVINIGKTTIIYQPTPGNNEGPHDIKTYGTTLDIVEHFPYLGSHLSQKATIEAKIQHRNILYHHILHGLRNRVTHNLMEETKVMVNKAVCTITLQERGVGYISMSFEDHQDIPPKLSKKDSLYPMGRSPPQCQCLEGQRSYSNEAMIMQNQLSLGLATVLVCWITAFPDKYYFHS